MLIGSTYRFSLQVTSFLGDVSAPTTVDVFKSPESLVSFIRSGAPHDLAQLESWSTLADRVQSTDVDPLPDSEHLATLDPHRAPAWRYAIARPSSAIEH